MPGTLDPYDVQTNAEIGLRIWKEAEFGKIPASPVIREQTKVSFDLGLKKDRIENTRMKRNRRASRSSDGGRRGEGTLTDLLSLRDNDDLIEAAACGEWTVAPSFTGGLTIDADGTLTRAAGSFLTDGFVAGFMVTLSGFDAEEDAGRFFIASLDAQDMVLIRDEDEHAEPVSFVAETASTATVAAIGKILRDGKIKHSFGTEEDRETLVTDRCEIGSGVRINTLGISIPAEGAINLNCGLIAQDVTLRDTPVPGTSHPAPNGVPLTGVNGEIYIDGESCGVVTTIDINFGNSIQGTRTVGRKTVRTLPNGKFAVTGSIGALLDSPKFLRAWQDGKTIEIALRLDTEDGKDFLLFLLPEVELVDCSAPTSGDGPATVTAQFVAIENTTADAVIIVQRSNIV